MESDKFFDAFSHETRRRIVKVLSLNTTMSYTELMSAPRITKTGKLSFHLKKMEILLSQNEEKRYLLSPLVAKPPSSYQTLRAPLIPPPS
jgi:predicted transcriptional regulator